MRCEICGLDPCETPGFCEHSRRGDSANWLQLCVMSEAKKPTPLPIVENACVALEKAGVWRLTFDEMALRAMLSASEPRAVSDDDVTVIQRWMQVSGLKRIGVKIVGQAIEHVARQNPYHPVREYLEALTWDGERRLNVWLSSCLGAERGAYNDAIGALFLRAMVARILYPGCKADHMLVLEGPQGELKSSACKILAGGDAYFSDSLPELTEHKECSIHLQGKWLIEITEMHAFNKAENTLLKSFLSRTDEDYRPVYGTYNIRQKRQCVFIGTSNKDAYLRDETGGRRFWPVKCGVIELTRLRTDRDQLLAEAVAEVRAGLPWWPDRTFERDHIKPEQDKRYEFDPWHDHVIKILEDLLPYVTVTNNLIAERLGVKTERLDPAVARRISAIMRKLGWNFKHTRAGNVWDKALERD